MGPESEVSAIFGYKASLIEKSDQHILGGEINKCFSFWSKNLLVIHKCSREQDAQETFTSLWLDRLNFIFHLLYRQAVVRIVTNAIIIPCYHAIC